MLANPTFYFWFNVILGVIFALCPLVYGFLTKQKVFAIGGFITSLAVVFFAGWLISLLCAGFFCLLIYNENKKIARAKELAAIREKNARREQELEENRHSEVFEGAWSGDLVNTLNSKEENSWEDEPLFEEEDKEEE